MWKILLVWIFGFWCLKKSKTFQIQINSNRLHTYNSDRWRDHFIRIRRKQNWTWTYNEVLRWSWWWDLRMLSDRMHSDEGKLLWTSGFEVHYSEGFWARDRLFFNFWIQWIRLCILQKCSWLLLIENMEDRTSSKAYSRNLKLLWLDNLQEIRHQLDQKAFFRIFRDKHYVPIKKLHVKD